MLARLSIVLPFNIAVARAAVFPVYEYETQGYKVRLFPPGYTEQRVATDPDDLTINGEPGVLANVLRIDFQRDTFDRRQGADRDPPATVITQAIASFVTRFRHVARAPQLRVPAFPNSAWRLEYRNDDDTPLEPAEGLIRAHGGMPFLTVSFVGLTTPIWTTIHGLPEDYEPLPWEVLLLDAQAELPKVGTAVVLSATALEVFIAGILDQLAKEQAVPQQLWSWITEREDYRQQPTPDQQYDKLLKFFTGHSLKEEGALWESFKNLKQARNTFVHEGVARIGTAPVDATRAGELIVAASQITAKVREWVPEQLRWPTYEHCLNFQFTKIIGTPGTATDQSAPGENDKKRPGPRA